MNKMAWLNGSQLVVTGDQQQEGTLALMSSCGLLNLVGWCGKKDAELDVPTK